MWAWLRRFFGRKKTEQQTPERVTVPTEPPKLRVISGGLDTQSRFEQLLSLTGQEEPSPLVLTPEEFDREEMLAERVREHFRENRPEPSTLPAVSLQVLNLVAEPEVSLSELSRVMSQDPAYSAAILKAVNSVAFAGTQEIESVREAVARLGIVEVSRVASVVSAQTLFQPQVRSEFAAFGSRWQDIFAESVVAARCAAWLSMRVKGSRGDQAFLAGILHDLGRSVALRSIAALSMREQCFEVEGTEIDRVVERVHVEIGADVHAHWGLPRFASLVAARHHDLFISGEDDLVDLHNVRLVSALVQFRRQPWRLAQVRAEVDESCLALHIDGFVLRSLDTQIRSEFESVFASLNPNTRRRSVSNV